MIENYQERIAALIEGLDSQRLVAAIELARVPELIRGFGHVKERAIEQARSTEQALLDRLNSIQPAGPVTATAEAFVERTARRV
jgi:indolepyruvate ferredoxin oxidoreductase